MNDSCNRLSKLARTRIPPIFCILIAGCGYAEYETRLTESRKYYAYLDKQEQSLAPKWSVAGNLMELRVPLQFNLIPAPQPIKLPDGKIEEPTIDPRQPDYINLTFPELFGAWQASFSVAKPNGTENCKGYIYTLCNYWQTAGKQASDAGKFVDNLKDLLTVTLRVRGVDEPAEVHPNGVAMYQYQQQVTYDVCRFKGMEINGTNYTFEVYSRTEGSVVGAVVIVLPEGMEMPQKVSERIPMMLASFRFTKNPPAAGVSASTPVQTTPAGSGF